MSKRRAGIMAGTAAAVAALTLSGASLAMAQSGTAPPETVPGGATSQTTSRDASSHTPVTGAEADAVIAAVVAVDADAVITEVRMDPDGSYDALGTSGDADVFYDVSADLASVAEGGGRGPGGGRGGDHADEAHVEVTGVEADAVIAAVVAVDADAVITEVRMDPDGSYDALGTSGDADVFYDVSADLASVTAGGGRGGHDGNGSRSDRPSDRSGATRGQDGDAATRTAPSAGANP